ncbi:glycerol 3-phosphate dehydrogenase (NAD(P)+) [Sulfuritortus calidifontis]|uniref:Glycerol-3-phosphate dehydrogenase [NAD(P)+] n=1 Tax=Sulfuritortus calidifontis TaxID=1914471 RepID=A0A4V6NYR4_9PROT|nr:NAD(P)H-dependent glycerol-3-phosphate dehydrogenase [Sulfuritortus calidifontis]TCS71882.1 glycerol 3-phosphate dehydrogenase (NAD(P)+) [Sulfuritortus calidifontis]
MKIAVLGAGAWGTGLAVRWAGSAQVTLWARNPEHLAAMRASRCNERYLPNVALPEALGLASDLAEAVRGVDYLVAAVPSAGFRGLLQQLAELRCRLPLVWLCKGFEAGSMKLPHAVLAEAWAGRGPAGVLSGPSFAQEVAAGQPAALTLAAADEAFARRAAQDLHAPALRLYSSSDVIGVEIGGALKNVIAIAAGVSDGLGFGHNARAALVTRGLAEMTRLGLKLGGRMETFMGLSGLGDLILTCTGDLSRNRQVGLRLAQGQSLEGILRELGHIAEGVTTAREACRLAGELSIEMPIADAVRRLLDSELTPKEAVAALLNREQKDEGV